VNDRYRGNTDTAGTETDQGWSGIAVHRAPRLSSRECSDLTMITGDQAIVGGGYMSARPSSTRLATHFSSGRGLGSCYGQKARSGR